MPDDASVWSYESRGRTPLHALCLAVAVGMVALGLWVPTPWYWTAGIALVTLCIAWLVFANPRARTTIDDVAITLGAARGTPARTIALADIVRVQVEDWTDGTDVRLILTDGRKVAVADWHRPAWRDFVAPLEARGIPVRVD